MRPNSIKSLDSSLFLEDVSLLDIAKKYPTPFYIYSKEMILAAIDSYLTNIRKRDLVCYSVKANSNLAILKIMAEKGMGFDVVSGGELFKVLKIGADPQKIIYSGVGKTKPELEYAVDNDIKSINIESLFELELLNQIGKEKNKVINTGIRVNPDIDAKSHPYIETGKADCKFGLSIDDAKRIADVSHDGVSISGISAHIGSQITDDELFGTLFNDLKALSEFFISKGHPINHIDVGGGLAIDYDFQESFSPELMTKKVIDMAGDTPIFFEPGRSLIGQAGSLVTEVLGIKINGKNKFLIVDAGMNDLIRPALYQANHKIEAISASGKTPEKYFVVGPVCETADSFGEFSISAQEQDHLVIYSVGAYGYSMASNYNSRLRAAEYLVDGSKITEIRKAESYEDLIKLEQY